MTFLKIKSLPYFRMEGSTAVVPDEYAGEIGLATTKERAAAYRPLPGLFDYQRDIAAMAIRKRKYSVFADCGLGKTLILLEFARHAAACLPKNRRVLIVSPLMVVSQTVEECERFYGRKIKIETLRASTLQKWLNGEGERVGIVNYEAMTDDLEAGQLGALILDESSMLKSHYGKWGTTCLRLGAGLEWKLALSGTPAPNDRIEYANHAVFMDQFPTVNSFLARFFVNRGQTDNRWELKPHALAPFYRTLSHWCIFLTNPATYGWKDNAGGIPPIHVHIHDVNLTREQRDIALDATGELFAGAATAGGITRRSKLAQLAKGRHQGADVETLKPGYIKSLVDSWPTESTIIWCLYNAEQETMERTFPEAGSIRGETPLEERQRIIHAFKSGTMRTIIAKPKTLGFGLNLQIATRQVFSGLQDSYESFYQAVKRSNRYGSTVPLNVHIPITEIERPMIETVLAKAKRVAHDTQQQEEIFREASKF